MTEKKTTKADKPLTVKGVDHQGKPLEFSLPTSFIGPLVEQLFERLVEYVQSPEGQTMIWSLVSGLIEKFFTKKKA